MHFNFCQYDSFWLLLRHTRLNGIRSIEVLFPRSDSSVSTAARTSLMDMFVCVSISLYSAGGFEFRPVDIGGNGCSIFMTGRSQAWRPLCLLSSQCLSVRSGSDWLSGRNLFPERLINEIVFYPRSCEEAD